MTWVWARVIFIDREIAGPDQSLDLSVQVEIDNKFHQSMGVL